MSNIMGVIDRVEKISQHMVKAYDAYEESSLGSKMAEMRGQPNERNWLWQEYLHVHSSIASIYGQGSIRAGVNVIFPAIKTFLGDLFRPDAEKVYISDEECDGLVRQEKKLEEIYQRLNAYSIALMDRMDELDGLERQKPESVL